MTLPSTQSVRAATVEVDGSISIGEAAPAPATEGRLVLRTVVSSICGSDLHAFRAPGHEFEQTDRLGHESIGIVEESADSRFPVGSRVLHMPVVEDGRTFADLQLARPSFVVPVPEGLPADHAVFGQQLGTVLWGLSHYAHETPDTVFIAGAGPAGLLFLQVLRGRGAERIVVSEPIAHRRELAERLGADVVAEPADALDAVREATDGAGVALAIDAAGPVAARDAALAAVRLGGTVGLFGLPTKGEPGIDVGVLFERNITLTATQRAQLEPGLLSFRAALGLIAEGSVDAESLISHRLPLDELDAGIRRAADISDGAVKVLIEVGPDAF
jgi:L-iditol 2-dehydrogenase